ncbi:PucR family transcriptional regulator [Paenisporosarcina indica]|uniref:PucR family transcriptional regulator n=1 Tax=Paenisporosarcina indica TaxID=650093 RepID=UPI00094FC0AB|nr:helix-turn-helix domain-containing protein [Paenisporosarcina indica]
MKTKLTELFPSYQLLSECPVEDDNESYIFHNTYTNNYMKIKKKEVSAREFALLLSLYKLITINTRASDSVSKKWIQFLYENGDAPVKETTDIRVIQLLYQTDTVKESDLEEAVTAYFGDSLQLVVLSSQEAVLIEQRSEYIQTVEDFSSFLVALESDFFINVKMYIGKFHSISPPFSSHFLTEKEWFSKGISTIRAERIYTMEKVFPFSLIAQMSDEMKEIIIKEVLLPINYDMELLQTMQQFFESGFNASVTAKKLHVHRNTLQYRLTKFQDMTGLSIRNFDGALVAFCASLIATEQ